MECLLVKKIKKVNDKTFTNYYLYFKDNEIMLPVEAKLLPQPKAENYKDSKDFQKEKDFREFVNTKFKTQLETMATLLKDED